MSSIAGLATTTAPHDVKNKIPNFSDLVIKTNYDSETKYIEDKYFTTSDYNKFTHETLDEKIKMKIWYFWIYKEH